MPGLVAALIPAPTTTASWLLLRRIGDFFSLVTALSGCVALPAAVAPFVLGKRTSPLRRPSIIGFTGLLLYVVLKAALLERHHTTGQEVFLAVGAAHLLGVSLLTHALTEPRPTWQRVVLGSATLMALSALVGHVAETLAGVTLLMWQLRVAHVSHLVGETGYLTALGAAAYGLLHYRQQPPPGRGFYFVALLLLGMIGSAYLILSRQLGQDFSLVLYGAQRLHALGEYSQLPYGVAIAIGLSAGMAGLLSRLPRRRRWAEALLLLLATGYAPRTPVTLITLALALSLIAHHSRNPQVFETD